MGTLIGIIRVNDGIVLGSDIATTRNKEPNIVKINATSAALLQGDLAAGKAFSDSTFSKFGAGWGNTAEIVQAAANALGAPVDAVKGHQFSVSIIGYDADFIQIPLTTLQFDGKAFKTINEQGLLWVQFSTDASLGSYIVTKVHTPAMKVGNAVGLMAYIIMQYNLVYGLGRGVNIATITRKGCEILAEDAILPVVEASDASDVRIKKRLYNLFLDLEELRK
ncbi:MAG: hypothetical protein JRN62_05970 [Nitrososphaerota archaeon]|jgi:hypothetical protein|nr:hypothetical protein [Nitrososphaerota archaeon]